MLTGTEEIIHAKRLLETRDNGFTIGTFLKRSTKPYLVTILMLSAGVFTFHTLDYRGGVYWTIGVFTGMVLRDFNWVRYIMKSLPFSLKVTDWQVVQSIADGTYIGEHPPA